MAKFIVPDPPPKLPKLTSAQRKVLDLYSDYDFSVQTFKRLDRFNVRFELQRFETFHPGWFRVENISLYVNDLGHPKLLNTYGYERKDEQEAPISLSRLDPQHPLGLKLFPLIWSANERREVHVEQLHDQTFKVLLLIDGKPANVSKSYKTATGAKKLARKWLDQQRQEAEMDKLVKLESELMDLVVNIQSANPLPRFSEPHTEVSLVQYPTLQTDIEEPWQQAIGHSSAAADKAIARFLEFLEKTVIPRASSARYWATVLKSKLKKLHDAEYQLTDEPQVVALIADIRSKADAYEVAYETRIKQILEAHNPVLAQTRSLIQEIDEMSDIGLIKLPNPDITAHEFWKAVYGIEPLPGQDQTAAVEHLKQRFLNATEQLITPQRHVVAEIMTRLEQLEQLKCQDERSLQRCRSFANLVAVYTKSFLSNCGLCFDQISRSWLKVHDSIPVYIRHDPDLAGFWVDDEFFTESSSLRGPLGETNSKPQSVPDRVVIVLTEFLLDAPETQWLGQSCPLPVNEAAAPIAA